MASAAPTPESTLRPIPPALTADPVRVETPNADLVPTAVALERAVLSEAPAAADGSEDAIPAVVLPLPVTVSVGIPVRNFRVRNLLAMQAGTVLETQWGHGEDLPLASGDVSLAWTEFEVIDTQLAVRVTRLA